MSWRFWEAPDTTISKRKSKSRTSFEEVEDEENEEDEEDDEEEENEVEKDTDYEAPEPEDTCAFQVEWQDWDEDDEKLRGEWWWKCALATNHDLKCQKDKCPFWKGGSKNEK